MSIGHQPPNRLSDPFRSHVIQLVGIAFVLFLPATILGQVFGEQRIISSAINDPEGLHYEDLDGDGAIDVLIGSSYSGSLVWFRNLGPGVYSNSISIDRLPGAILHITTADLNTDGHLDVVVSGGNFGFSLSYYPNDGLGNFGGPVPINGTSDGFFDVHCADIDGDDDLDVVASARWGNYLAWFENDGTGTFIETYNLEVIEFPMGLVVDDMDGDEDIDIIVAVAASVNQNAHILQFTNEGDGLFGAGALLDEPDGGSGHIISVDFDGDGDLDLATVEPWDNQVALYSNNGDGAFSDPVVVGDSISGAARLLVTDLNGDQLSDFVISTGSSGNTVWGILNAGDGLFNDPQTIAVGLDSPQLIACFDQDGDGDQDVAFASSSQDKIALAQNEGFGTFEPYVWIQTGVTEAESVVFADVDGDGDLDALSATRGDQKISWFENDGSANFSIEHILSLEYKTYEIVATDFDGDGDTDLAAAAHEYLLWFENDGDGVFTEHLLQYTINRTFEAVVAADFDEDGFVDLAAGSDAFAVACSNCTVGLFMNNPSGGFSPSVPIDAQILGLNNIELGDIDGDGDLDILASASGNDDLIGWLENLGGGSFSSVIPINQTLNYPSSLQVVDLDGDGHQDVLATNLSWVDEKMCWWPNLGGGNFEGYTTIEDDVYQPECAIGADFDSDGDIDIVSGVGCCDLTYFENLGAGDFAEGILITENVNQANSLFVADIDDDGDLDVASSSSGDNKIAWYPNTQGEGCLDPVATNYDPDAWIDNGSCCLMPSSCSGDTNCDGLVDSLDVLSVLGSFDCVGFDCPLDMDGDGVVGVSDFMLVLGGFGMECE